MFFIVRLHKFSLKKDNLIQHQWEDMCNGDLLVEEEKN
jgi:hypothetical protein